MNSLASINCPYCKGQTRNDRKTLYLYASNTYWCARCKAHGYVDSLDLDNINLTPKTTAIQIKSFQYNNQGKRFSVCKQRHNTEGRDIFQIKKANGTVTGHYYRTLETKQSMIEGPKYFSYREEYLDPSQTYRLVEGPYDCIYPNDVSLLGYPTKEQAKQLRHYNLILCPDGDVWKDLNNLKQWLFPFWFFERVAVEYIPNFKDPDETPLDLRKTEEFSVIKNWLRKKGY